MARTELSLLSCNIQAGSSTSRYREYLTRGLNHLLPIGKRDSLDSIAELARAFDIVGLQESDPGSLRSGFTNQTHYLAERSGFPFWSHQPNRRVGRIASSANGLLSRFEPSDVRDYALPGRLPGRGVLVARFGSEHDALTVAIAHLSLGIQSRRDQIAFLTELLADASHAVLMGDFNCPPDAAEMQALYRHTRLRPPIQTVATFPSWRPSRALDHILISDTLSVLHQRALPAARSDHLAIAATISIPTHCLPG
ncbi:MAG TPA: endonuclease [Xanthomonadales bacterium]|nr:endonuclease [Xanthomonadales bacterium]